MSSQSLEGAHRCPMILASWMSSGRCIRPFIGPMRPSSSSFELLCSPWRRALSTWSTNMRNEEMTLLGEDDSRQGCQNRDSAIRFYDFTIQTNPFDSTILLHIIYVSTILIVKILRFAILPSELRSDSKSRFWQPWELVNSFNPSRREFRAPE